MATYNISTDAPTLALQEQSILGGSRLGLLTQQGKQYELSDHLSNVRTVINENNTVASATDYYPFGMVAKSYSNSYKYGFNGQEKVDEIAPGHTTAEYWEYDSRLGRRWNLDPKPNLSLSSYSVFANNPILYSDTEGDTIRFQGTAEEKVKYDAQIKRLSASELFVKYYTKLEESKTVYTVKYDPTLKKGGQFSHKTNTVTLKSENGDYTASQELFHAYQKDVIKSTYGQYAGNYQNIEMEGDLVSSYVTIEAGLISVTKDHVSELVEMTKLSTPTKQQLNSEEFNTAYKKGLNQRYSTYKDNADVQKNAPSYIQPPSDKGPEALKTLITE